MICIVVICFLVFTAYNLLNQNIAYGVSIKGVDVSNLSRSDARYQLDNYITANIPTEIKLKHGDFETTLSLEQLGVEFDTKSVVDSAYRIGREGNIFKSGKSKSMRDHYPGKRNPKGRTSGRQP